MVNEFKNLILAGLGSAAYTYEKASKLVEDMVAKGKLTIDEGKELSEELKRNLKDKVEEVKPITKEDLISILNQMNFSSKDDLKNIEQRLNTLEEKINTKY
ncbi:phasin family protein [Clostridium thailandense]|uniref:phasin family protein n=1 Tax=Clostridium thailandense TaxID=2794346 RepID=UPI00398A2DFB